ncbi:MAG: hypothetical protein RL329_1971, partial [Bacteroidota bacterium]
MQPQHQDIPQSLVYEIMDGVPIYYRGYKEVLKKNKTIQQIMPCSTLQAHINYYLTRVIIKSPLDDHYFVHTSESGLHISHNDNFGCDIALFDKTVLLPKEVTLKYATVPPTIVFEIDIRGDILNMSEESYMYKKTQKLLDFGVQKVIWITSASKKVMVATSVD